MADDQIIKARALDSYQALLASQGDRRAFELLYKRWHPKLLRFAMRKIGHSDAAQDVMQDAALAIAKNIHRLQDPDNFTAWAYTIVRRKAADHIGKLIKTRRLKDEFSQEPILNSSNDPETDLTLKQALSELPDEARLLLTLFYVDGLTGPELSAALGIPIGTVKSRLFKARTKLKSIYQTKGDDHV